MHDIFQDDDDGHLTALQIIQDVVRKGGELFLDNFARLGLFGKVLALAGPPEEESNEAGNDKVEVNAFPIVFFILVIYRVKMFSLGQKKNLEIYTL